MSMTLMMLLPAGTAESPASVAADLASRRAVVYLPPRAPTTRRDERSSLARLACLGERACRTRLRRVWAASARHVRLAESRQPQRRHRATTTGTASTKTTAASNARSGGRPSAGVGSPGAWRRRRGRAERVRRVFQRHARRRDRRRRRATAAGHTRGRLRADPRFYPGWPNGGRDSCGLARRRRPCRAECD